jgi:flagellar basal-body rod protein FlgC
MMPLPPNLVEADAVSTAFSGMHAQRIRMNAIANNLANTHTTRAADGSFAPFLRKEVIFRTQELNPNKPYEQGVEVQSILESQQPLRRIHDPDHPEADATGYRFEPNISVPIEMVSMIEASRAYEANLRSMKVASNSLRLTDSILEPVNV